MFSNGDSYSGDYKNGQRNGNGIYTYFNDRSQLIGEWENDKFINGKWRFGDLTEYIGNFDHNNPIGDGIFKFPSKNQCSGCYENGLWRNQAIIYNPYTD